MREIDSCLLACHAALLRRDYRAAISWAERALALMRAEMERLQSPQGRPDNPPAT